MMDTIFKKGDRVYDAMLGWGEIKNLNNLSRYFEVLFDTGTSVYYCEDGSLYDNQNRNSFKPTLSFNQYQLDGFSQERPENLPHKGDIVWVRDGKIFNWEVYHFIKHEPNDEFPYIVSIDCDINNSIAFKYLTTLNPYINEHR
jgi:hypothetical protein